MRLLRSAALLGTVLACSTAVAAPPAPSTDATLARAEQAMIVDPAEVIRILRTLAPPSNGPRTAAVAAPTLSSIRALWLEGEALGRLNEIAGADRQTALALAQIEQVAPGSQLHGRVLMSRGAVELDRGNVRGAFLAYRKAHAIFERVHDARNQALALQNIGSIYSDAGDQKSVMRYYAQSADVYDADPGLAISAHNNIGLAYKKMGQPRRAEQEYRQALVLAVTMKSPLLEARILNNIGSVQLALGNLSAAGVSADRGLRLVRSGAAREWAPFLWGLKAQVAYRNGDANGAVALLQRAFAGADLSKTSFYFRDFHETAVDAYLSVGDKEMAIRHLRALKRLDDEAREIRSSTNTALSAAQFDYSNQELKITKLKAGQLERDVMIARARARLNTIILSAALLLLAVTLVGLLSVRRSRNQTRAANLRLTDTNSSLDKALKAKSEFLATTSHEIRTPLNGILGMTQVLLGGRELVDTVRERVTLIDVAGNAMKAIVDDILDMAKIESGRVEVTVAPFALRRLVDEVGMLWRVEAENKGVAVTLETAGAPEWVVGDERKVRQIVFNLMSNAVKFTDTGTVAVSVVCAGVDDGEEIQISVTDTGIGIAPEDQASVFEAFHQVHGGTTRKVGGTGLGLAICRNLAEAMGGRVAIASEVGRGSTFTLAMPLALADTADTPAATGTVPERLADARVLFLDANLLFQSVIGAGLQDAVGALDAVSTLDEALAAIERSVPHLLLVDTDSLTDTGDGLGILRSACPDAPLLLLSANDTAGTKLLPDGSTVAQFRKALPPVGLAAMLQTLLVHAAETPVRDAA